MRGTGPINVVFVLRTLTTYRIPFLTRLSQLSPGIRLAVIAGDGVVEAGKLDSGARSLPFPSFRVRGYVRDIWNFTLVWLSGCVRVLRSLPCDVVILEGNFGILSHIVAAVWAKLTGRTVIFWVAGFQKPEIVGIRARARELFMRVVMKAADGFVCYSSDAARWLERLGAPPECVRVAQNTIDTESIVAARPQVLDAALQLREHLGWAGKPVMVYVGAITHDKHPARLLDLHRALRARGIDVRTLIVGDGPAMSALRAAAEAEEGVHLAGRVVDAVDRYFAAGDVFVLPSIGGLAINQAMANGLPVVCGPADGTGPDLVRDGLTGYFRETYDLDEWTQCIARILTQPPLREQMGRASLDRVLQVASLEGMCRHFSTAILRSRGRT